MKKRILSLLLVILFTVSLMPLDVFAVSGTVATVGSTEYTDIDAAVTAWQSSNNSVLTLKADVTLGAPAVLKSTYTYTLNLGTFTMTAASGKNAIEITPETQNNDNHKCLIINSDAQNPGGITAPGKSCIYYKKTASFKDRSQIVINGGNFLGCHTLDIYSNGNTNCIQVYINGGTFSSDGTPVTGWKDAPFYLRKCRFITSGGVFNTAVYCDGDTNAYRLFKAGKFESFKFLTEQSDTQKLTFGTSVSNYNNGLYVDDNDYLNVGGSVITSAGTTYQAKGSYSSWSTYLQYSSAITNGLYYTSALSALTNHTSAAFTLYPDNFGNALDLTGINYKGTITLPEADDFLNITFAEGTTPEWKVTTALAGKIVVYTDSINAGVVTRAYAVKDAYTVNHHLQKVDQSGYTVDTTEILGDDAGQLTAAAAKTYTGFTVKPFAQKTIEVGGGTAIDIYYDRIPYTVTYKADGTVVDTQQVVYQGNAVAPAIPDKEGYTQTAPVWDNDGTNITVDTTINAVYTANNYTVTYKIDGVTVDTQTVAHGADAVAPVIPDKEGYTQTAPVWDNDGTNITADTTINAVYTINTYTVTYKADGATVNTQTVAHGADAVAPAIPDKEGYTQTAPVWDNDGTNITVDTTINAVYTANNYTVTYKIDGVTVDTQTVAHGADAAAPTIPDKEGYTQTAPTWDNNGKNITADTTINAVYTINTYTVTYKADGATVNTQTVAHGADAVAPAIPVKEGYDDTAPMWDNDGTNITADTVINAVYVKNLPGEFEDTTPADNAADGKLNQDIDKVKDSIPFTPEETQDIQLGYDVDIWLDVNDITDTVSADEKVLVAEKIGKDTAAMYLDIVMYKQIEESQPVALDKLDSAVNIVIRLTDELINKDTSVVRTYYIVHVHDGETEIITPVYDKAAQTLTFPADEFSTYTVVYRDTAAVTNPDTGDTFDHTLFVIAAASGIAALTLKKKKAF